MPRCRSALVLPLVFAASCGSREPKVREKTFLTVEPPVKVSDLTHSSIVRAPGGTLFMTAFLHSTFPSATEPAEAIAVFESKDDGGTWQRISSIPSFVTYGVWEYDLVIDAAGRLSMTWVAAVYDAEARRPFKAVMFARSDAAGRTWTEPVRVSRLTVNQRRNPAMAVSGDAVHMAWLDEREAGRTAHEDVLVASSADRGATWSAEVCPETDLDKKPSGSGAPALCVGADGALSCAWFAMRGTGKKVGGYALARSADQGKTFATALHDAGPLGEVCLAAGPGGLFLGAVRITGIKAITPPDTDHEISLFVSTDGGGRWGQPVRIDDDEGRQRKASLRLASAGTDRLVACWDDGRGGVYVAASIDGGETWGKNVKVAERSQVGLTPLSMAADPAAGAVYLLVSDIHKGGGDATYFVKAKVAP